MNSVEVSMKAPRQAPQWLATIGRAAASHRIYIYVACTTAALLTSYVLGKDMRWDTLDYHFYAGFSALHSRFGQDYFPAGSQTYFNPYVYAPFYALATSGLPPLAVASILAVVQSGILWLTYELALQVAPAEDRRAQVVMPILAVILAFGNPILINQFGSSYADITTAELVLAGWLLLARAVASAGTGSIICAGVMLGAASALKMTNCVHALSAGILLLFLPTDWYRRSREAALFGLTVAVSFIIVTAPWSIRLQQHFGNPLFPLLNNVFRSPQYPIATMLDYRFVPDSLAEALWRPFEIVAPKFAVDDELQAPDLRYAVVVVAALVGLLLWTWRRIRRSPRPVASADDLVRTRTLAALGCGLLVDWSLWLRLSANGRYFLPMACVAAVVGIALLFRVFSLQPRIRNTLLAVLFSTQVLQLYMGADYRDYVPWTNAPWFEVEVPGSLAAKPELFLSYGMQSHSFLVPFLARGSGFINLGGDYQLVREGENGKKVESLIHRFAPHLRVIVPEARVPGNPYPVMSLAAANNAMKTFGLRADASDCSTIIVPNEGPQPSSLVVFVDGRRRVAPGSAARVPGTPRAVPNTEYLATCRVVPDRSDTAALVVSEKKANFVLDRLEDACPALFQPRRPVTVYYGDKDHTHVWARRYLNTNLTAWTSRGWVEFIDPVRGGPVNYIGPESAFAKSAPRIDCGRRDERYYAKLLPDPR